MLQTLQPLKILDQNQATNLPGVLVFSCLVLSHNNLHRSK